MNINDIINAIIAREGGFVDHPDDRGGPTNFGITLATYREYFAGGTVNDLRNMSKATAYTIYERKYYLDSGISLIYPLSVPIAGEVLDTGVNMGTGTAIRFLQRALNAFNLKATIYPDIAEDGQLGPMTANALERYLRYRGAEGETVMLKALNCLQGARYIDISQANESQESFVYGWINRNVKL